MRGVKAQNIRASEAIKRFEVDPGTRIKLEKEIYYINANMFDSNSSTVNLMKKTFPSKYKEFTLQYGNGIN